MAAVSNSSPLIFYAAIGRLDLLRTLFTRLFVPPAVWREVVTDSPNRVGAREVERAGWIVLQPFRRQSLPRAIEFLDPGEAEAIALASSLPMNVQILLDDYRARQIAREIGLQVVGSGGVLILANDAGLIDSIGPMLSELRAAGLYLSDRTAHELLELAGER